MFKTITFALTAGKNSAHMRPVFWHSARSKILCKINNVQELKQEHYRHVVNLSQSVLFFNRTEEEPCFYSVSSFIEDKNASYDCFILTNAYCII